MGLMLTITSQNVRFTGDVLRMKRAGTHERRTGSKLSRHKDVPIKVP